MAGGGGGEGDLNLVPYMDIMVNLIMFMLIVTAYIVELREAPVLAPAYGSGGGGDSDKPKPFLTVVIAKAGFGVVASGGISGADLPLEAGKYPYAELTQTLRNYRTNNEELAENLVITAAAEVPYSVVVATMDAARTDSNGPLFPGVTLGLAVGVK